MKKIIVIGAGGQGRETKFLIEQMPTNGYGKPLYDFVGYVLSDMKYVGDRDSKDEILGDFDWLMNNRDKFDYLVLGIGSPELRLKFVNELSEFEVWPTLIHPAVSIDKSCVIGCGICVCAGVLPTVNVKLDSFCMINQGVTLGHESIIGRGSVVNPGANISGGVEIGEGCLIGANACVLEYCKIGDGATVGAGAVVTKDVEPGDTVIGIPAKSI